MTAQRSQHVHPREGLGLQQHGYVMPINLEDMCVFERDRAGLMWRLIQHRSEAEKLALLRLGDHYLLLIFVNGGEANLARDHDVSPAARIAHLINALARSEVLDLNLSGQDCQLLVIEQGKERNFPQCLRVTCHESPHTLGNQSRVE